eukprot:gene10142-2561_t
MFKKSIILTFSQGFIAHQAVDTISIILTVQNIFDTHNLREDSILVLELFRKMGYIEHVVVKLKPISDYLFYKFKTIPKEESVFHDNFKAKFDAYTVIEKLDLHTNDYSSDYFGKVFLKFLSQIEVKNRKYKLKNYSNCWIASEAVEWGLKNTKFTTTELIMVFNFYRKCGLIQHVVDQSKPFTNEYLFFRFEKFIQQLKKTHQI